MLVFYDTGGPLGSPVPGRCYRSDFSAWAARLGPLDRLTVGLRYEHLFFIVYIFPRMD